MSEEKDAATIEYEKFQEDIRYEVALEILGQTKAPYVNAIFEEMRKENPNQRYLDFLEEKKWAIDRLLDDLSPDDKYLIGKILDPNNKAMRW